MKTIITDLDGTLLSSQGLSEYTIEVLNKFQENNRLILATGRNLDSVDWIRKSLNMDKYKNGGMILVNGAAYYDLKDEALEVGNYLSESQIKKLRLVGHLSFSTINICSIDDRVELFSFSYPFFQLARFLFRGRKIKNWGFKKNKPIPKEPLKVEFFGFCSRPYFYPFFKRYLEKEFEVYKVSKNWIEVLPKHTGKEKQVEKVIKKYHIDLDDLYIFGDGENDCGMLHMSKHSYCPQNALEMARLSATYQMSDLDGVAKIALELMDNQ